MPFSSDYRLGYYLLIFFCVSSAVNGNIWQSWTRVDHTTIYTPNDFRYNYVWLSVERRFGLVFQVKACSDAHIAFSQYIEIHEYPTTEVVIGGWSNSQSVIRRGIGKEHYFTLSTRDILHCNEFRTFWVTWRDNYIKVGRGPMFGEQTFLNWQLKQDQIHEVNAVSVATGWGHTGAWRFKQNQANSLYFATPNYFKYEYAWRTRALEKNIVFKVRACNDASLALSAYEGAARWDSYEIILGGWKNTKSVIRVGIKTQATKAEYKQPVLNCNEYRTFWISWVKGEIKVGTGILIGTNQIMAWKDPKYHQVKALGFTTGYGSTGFWHFNEDLEDRYIFSLPNDNSFDYARIVMPEVKFTTFRVQACSDSKIALSLIPGKIDDTATQIWLGAQSNSKTIIMKGLDPNPVATFDTPNVLNCYESRTFWLMWDNYTIEMGRGPVYRQRTILTVPARWMGVFPPSSLSLAQNKGSIGTWVIKSNTGVGMSQKTIASTAFGRVWYTARTRQYIVFKVKACSNAEVALSGMIGEYEDQTYEVSIGWGNNQKTLIREPSNKGPILVSANTPGILDCRNYRVFWISWLDGIVKFGKGYRITENYVIGVANPKPHPINAFTIRTMEQPGDWKFTEDMGDHVVAFTQDNANDDHKWLYLYTGTKIFYFRVRAARDASLLLAESYENRINAYILKIGTMGNTKVELWDRRTEKMVKDAQVSGLLSNDELRPFWVAWNRFTPRTIEVGQGYIYGQNNIMKYDAPNPQTIQAISITTGAGSTGEWRFARDSGYYMLYDTQPSFTYHNVWLTVKHTSRFRFDVAACDNAYIYLTSIIAVPSMFTYEIKLTNTKSSIAQGHEGLVYLSVDTPNILNCQVPAQFWITWIDGNIRVGKGGITGKNTIMAWQDLNPHPVASVGIATDKNAQRAEWNFLTDENAVGPTRPPVTQVPGPTQGVSGPGGLTPGQTAGAVIGFLFLFALAGAAAYVILRPPAPLQKFLGPKVAMPGRGFDNPMSSPTTDLPSEGASQPKIF